MTKRKLTLTLLLAIIALIFLTGCDLVPMHMRDQPRYDPLEQSQFFANGADARLLPANTIPRGAWGAAILDEPFYTGKVNDEFVETIPAPVTADLMARGQKNYNTFCLPCHGRVGYGDGMIVQRGFPQPPSFHIDRLREAPDGLYYDVMTNGFGVMYSYKSRINPEERWAIVAYVRALQLSQNVPVDELPADAQSELE
jgi:mono/diheme cytochrome c family protein